VNLFNENLSSIFSWFRTTLFRTFFVFNDFINKKEVKKRYFDRVSQNDLGFSSSNVNFLQHNALLQMRHLISRAEGGLILLIYIHLVAKNFRQTPVFMFYCPKKFYNGCGGGGGFGAPPPPHPTHTN
jgi:hypothetical protein